jgi:hypothetical protein
MAKFANNTLTQVAGFDGQILAQELVYNQKDFWNITWSNNVDGVVTPVDLTNVTIDAQIIRRTITDVQDGRYGLEFNIFDYPSYIDSWDSTSTTVNQTDQDYIYIATGPNEIQLGDTIRFTGTSFGNIQVGVIYYIVYYYNNGSDFKIKISLTKNGNPITLTSEICYLSVQKATYGPTAIDLTITNRVDVDGQFTLVIDDDTWDVMANDPELNIAVNDPVCFSGRIKLSFPSISIQPEYDEQIFLLFLIRSDGVVN